MTYKKKIRILFLCTGVVTALLVKYRFLPTVNSWIEVTEVKKEAFRAQEAAGEREELESRLNHNKAMFPDKQADQLKVLETITSFCNGNNISLKAVSACMTDTSDGYVITTRPFLVSGSFRDINGLLYELEQRKHAGVVGSAVFETVKDRKTGKSELTALIHLLNPGKL